MSGVEVGDGGTRDDPPPHGERACVHHVLRQTGRSEHSPVWDLGPIQVTVQATDPQSMSSLLLAIGNYMGTEEVGHQDGARQVQTCSLAQPWGPCVSLKWGRLLGENDPLGLVPQGCDGLGEPRAAEPQPHVGGRGTLQASEVSAEGAGRGHSCRAQAGTEGLLSTGWETLRPQGSCGRNWEGMVVCSPSRWLCDPLGLGLLAARGWRGGPQTPSQGVWTGSPTSPWLRWHLPLGVLPWHPSWLQLDCSP